MVGLASSLIINDGFYTCSFQLDNEGFNLSGVLQILHFKKYFIYIHIYDIGLTYYVPTGQFINLSSRD